MSFFNKIIVAIVQLMPKAMVGFFSKRYIAGETLDNAVELVKKLNEKNIYATIDVLGESVKNKEEAVSAKNKALEVLATIAKNNLKANLSIKPTQMGLAIDENFALKQISELIEKARENNNFVRIDMEDSPYTDLTFSLYKKLRNNYDNVGVVIQAYLKRTYDDVILLNKLGTNYRLCKGIYIESPNIAYKEKQVIRENYLKILEAILKTGNYIGIATHDEYLINNASKLVKELNLTNDKFEFQMLLGVREDLRDKINSAGHKIRIYVPFGKDWYAYSVRRLKENPQIAGYVFKSLFSLKK
ncbi:MAG: proline dehydrogenase family protein [Bacteroidetes bacterium]|nr:proline dehydrogenase family protein [Bacteroidota bacterium]